MAAASQRAVLRDHQHGKSRVRVARVWREGEAVLLEFASRSFLHRQVRSMTGTLAEVGVGRWPAGRVREALLARDRRACGPVAPAEGLYLVGVRYEGDASAAED